MPSAGGATVSLAERSSERATLVMFICNHCPFVKHVADQLAALGNEYQAKGVAVIAISSNDVSSHPDDSAAKMVEEAKLRGYEFPYLYDETQEVAKSYKAACTPDFFLFDGDRKLVYRGQLDGSRPGNDVPVTGKDLRAALDAVMGPGRVPDEQIPSLGCNIKWKPGNAPDYFG